MLWSPQDSDSRSDSSSARFASGENGTCPAAARSGPGPSRLRTCSRTASLVIPSSCEDLHHDPGGHAGQGEHEVLGSDRPMAHRSRFVLRAPDDLTGLFGEALEHPQSIPPPRRSHKPLASQRTARPWFASQPRGLSADRVPCTPVGSAVGCLRPFSPTVGRTASRSTTVSLSLARGLGSASGRRPAVRATSTTGSPQGGNQR